MEKAKRFFNYLISAIPKKENRKIDIIITSHLHSDHYGGTPKLLELLFANGWGVYRIIDRNGGIAPDPNVPCYTTDGIVVDNDPVPPEYAEPASNLYQRYISACDTYYPNARENYLVGTELISQVLKKTDYVFKFWNLANNACVLKQYGTYETDCYKANNENDLSNVWLVEYQGFKYFTGGDIGGGGGSYLNLETPLCHTFLTWPDSGNFHLCSFKVSHHGSAHSTNSDFVSTGCSDPTLAIVPSALRSFSGTQIPTYDTLNRIATHPTSLLYTFIKDDGVYYSGSVNYYNHVVLSIINPGFGKPIQMAANEYAISKSDLTGPTNYWNSQTFTCPKNHDAPTIEDYVISSLDDQLDETFQKHTNLNGYITSDKQHYYETGEVLVTASTRSSKQDKRLERLERKKIRQQERFMRRERNMLRRYKKRSERRSEQQN